MRIFNKIKGIADPWYTGNFDETYEDVLAGCRGLMRTMAASREGV